MPPQITVVIPARNEDSVIGRNLELLARARTRYEAEKGAKAEVIVVANGCTDGTAAIATAAGATVLELPAIGIPAARNAGAEAAGADRLIFCDADTEVGEDLLTGAHDALSDPRCFGGAPRAIYDYRKRSLWLHMQIWRVVARVRSMTQGVCQFCTAEAFEAVGGYPVEMKMAEDTEFYWRLCRYAKWHGGFVKVLDDVAVIASSRRLDEWPVWKTMLLTNPITTRLCLRSPRLWKSWEDGSIR